MIILLVFARNLRQRAVSDGMPRVTLYALLAASLWKPQQHFSYTTGFGGALHVNMQRVRSRQSRPATRPLAVRGFQTQVEC